MSEDESHTDDERATNSRRQFLGGMAGLGGLFGAGTTTAERGSGGNAPFAPDEHDHSGERGSTASLGVASPVKSINVHELFSARQGRTISVSQLPSISGSGTESDPYTSPSGTAGMREAFEWLNEIGGGVIYYPSGFYGDGTTSWEIDLAEYDTLRNNWAIYGDGLESSRIRAGSDSGNGIRIHDSEGTAMFYTEIVGVRFEGENAGFTFVWGSENLGDAYNSCFTRFSTSNGDPDGTGACQLNFVLNSYHYGVHNATGGTALECRRVQFSGIEGSVSSGETAGDVAMDIVEYSFGNRFSYLNVEATYDGIHITDQRAIGNVFDNAYFANVRGTAFVQQIESTDGRFPGISDQGTYFHNPFVAGAINRIAEIDDSAVYVYGSTKEWPDTTVQVYQGERTGGSQTDQRHVGFEPRSEPPEHDLGRVALADGDGWDPTGDGVPALTVSTGDTWRVLERLG